MNFLTWQSVLNTENLQKAYEHVQKKRKENGPNSDWYLTGPIDLKTLQNHLLSGKYTPSPVEELHLKLPKKDTVLWRRTPIDAIVLRAIYQVLLPAIKLLLPKSPFHLPGKGGVKKAISLLNGVFQARKKESGFILRTDVKDFYQSIRHEELFSLLDRLIEDKELNAILKLLIKTPTYKGGIYQDWFGLGISKGCSLSPLFGALILANVDSHFARRVQRTPGIIYIRYMDDFFIFAPKRSLLRPLIRQLRQGLADHGMIFHPDKTSIGPLSKGFSFLGYSYKKGRWKIRPETIVQSLGKIRELLESRCKEKTAIARSQLPRWVNRQKKPAPSVVEYVTRFLGWAVRGLTHLPLSIPTPGKLIHTAERLSSLPYNLI